ncbi:monocyte to macrophage differentiation factor isoform X2 [Lepus europaeus]|uniref:monocyte to macrophage differentiation factor isoform X2 n=1 Tax=Lepus europaeus TaxID=9983 RepID=UPI002B481279|nr:monocyte to macrophage differentiation factor isoform X2 [Lepus europaeus]
MRFQNRFQRFMNHRAPANGRYKPTCYEHAANCYTHAFLIVPAIVGSALLHRLSDDCWEKITAWIYGMGLCALFIVSTVFHIVSWKKSHLRLNLRELGPLASHMRWFIWLMAAGGTIYVFLYHEKYKVVELFFYLTMGFSPALVVTSMVSAVLHSCLKIFCRYGPMQITAPRQHAHEASRRHEAPWGRALIPSAATALTSKQSLHGGDGASYCTARQKYPPDANEDCSGNRDYFFSLFFSPTFCEVSIMSNFTFKIRK